MKQNVDIIVYWYTPCFSVVIGQLGISFCWDFFSHLQLKGSEQQIRQYCMISKVTQDFSSKSEITSLFYPLPENGSQPFSQRTVL
jgi:hypothetical protein